MSDCHKGSVLLSSCVSARYKVLAHCHKGAVFLSPGISVRYKVSSDCHKSDLLLSLLLSSNVFVGDNAWSECQEVSANYSEV